MSRRGRGITTNASDSTSDVVLRTFTFLLCAGVLLHEIQLGAAPWGFHLLVVIAAVIGLTRPGIPALVGLFGMLAVELLVDLPAPWNHAFVMGVLGGGLALWWLATPTAAWRHEPAAFLSRVGPVIRVTVIVIWALAFVAKLNHDFLDTASSCAIWILEQVPLVAVPDAASGAVIVGALAVEGLVPLLLVFRRTRLLGVAGAWGFHLVAALGGHTAFSGIALPLYLLFLSGDLVATSVRWVREHTPRADTVAAVWRRPLTPVVLLLLLVVGMTLVQQAPSAQAVRGHRYVPMLLYLPVAATYAVALIVGVWRHRGAAAEPEDAPGALRLRGVVPIAIVLALLLNAATPYLGLKTGWSLTMYSNLRTEPGEWNHLLVPEDVRVFGWQDGLVTVYDAPPDVARRLGLGSPPTPHRVPRLRLLRAAIEDPRAPVQLDAEGSDVRPLSEVVDGDFTFLHARLVRVRSVPLTPRCQV